MTHKKQLVLTAVFVLCTIGLVLFGRPVKAQIKMTDIVILARDVAAASYLSADDLKLISVPDEIAGEQYFENISDAAGKWTDSMLYAEEWLHRKKLSSKPEGLSFPVAGNDDKNRLITLALAAEAVNGYWLAAGNYVDIDIISRDKSQKNPITSLENIEVAALLSRQSTANSEIHALSNEINSPLVCLKVNREQAKLLAEASVHSDIRLSVICR
jgi:Flp pilus assembly protein CpaB